MFMPTNFVKTLVCVSVMQILPVGLANKAYMSTKMQNQTHLQKFSFFRIKTMIQKQKYSSKYCINMK